MKQVVHHWTALVMVMTKHTKCLAEKNSFSKYELSTYHIISSASHQAGWCRDLSYDNHSDGLTSKNDFATWSEPSSILIQHWWTNEHQIICFRASTATNLPRRFWLKLNHDRQGIVHFSHVFSHLSTPPTVIMRLTVVLGEFGETFFLQTVWSPTQVVDPIHVNFHCLDIHHNLFLITVILYCSSLSCVHSLRHGCHFLFSWYCRCTIILF